MSGLPNRPFLHSDLVDLGITRRKLRNHLHHGDLRRVFRGVYLPTALADTIENRASCAALAASPGHIAVDRTAAWIHGVDTFGWAEHEAIPDAEFCRLPRQHPTELSGILGRNRDLADDDIMRIGNLRVTTPLRTALDLGCGLRRREALAALIEFNRLHGVGPGALLTSLERFRGRRGVVQLRALVGLVDARIESPREAWVWLEVIEAGLPRPVPQFWIVIDGIPTYRLDFAWPKSRVTVEYDGEEFHSRTPEQKMHDEERRAWLRAHGWTVIVVRLGDFTDLRWLQGLRKALASTYSTRRW